MNKISYDERKIREGDTLIVESWNESESDYLVGKRLYVKSIEHESDEDGNWVYFNTYDADGFAQRFEIDDVECIVFR